MTTRVGLPLLVTAAMLAASAVALGRPDLNLALAFLGGGWPTTGETLAALELLVWAIVLVGAARNLGVLGWEVAHRAAESRRFREGSALAGGLLILIVGAAHHASAQVGMSGGTAQEALSFLGR